MISLNRLINGILLISVLLILLSSCVYKNNRTYTREELANMFTVIGHEAHHWNSVSFDKESKEINICIYCPHDIKNNLFKSLHFEKTVVNFYSIDIKKEEGKAWINFIKVDDAQRHFEKPDVKWSYSRLGDDFSVNAKILLSEEQSLIFFNSKKIKWRSKYHDKELGTFIYDVDIPINNL